MLVKRESYFLTLNDSWVAENTVEAFDRLKEWLDKYPKSKWDHTVDNSVPNQTTYLVVKK